MGKIFVVAKREYLERVRSRWFLMATVFGPVLMAVLIILPGYLAMKTKPSDVVGHIAVLDASGTDVGARVGKLVGAGRGQVPEVRAVSPLGLTEAESTATREVREKR